MAEQPEAKNEFDWLDSSFDPDAPAEVKLERVVNGVVPFLRQTIARVEKLPKTLDATEGALSKTHSNMTTLHNEVRDVSALYTAMQSKLKRMEASISDATSRLLMEVDDQSRTLQSEFKEGMKAAEAAFTEQQAIREPVKLWAIKQQEHDTAKKTGFWTFVLGLLLAAAMVCGLIYTLATQPAYVETLLAPIGCNPKVPEAVCSGFSLKGTLISAGVLTLFTLLLWFTRLQMKLFLAERHLALDARERQAFAQSYIGLVREGDTSEEAQEQRALVYAALFRPASDGTVREDGGLDPSVAAAVSKLLTR